MEDNKDHEKSVAEMLYFSTPPRDQGVLEIPRKRYGYVVRCDSGFNKSNFGRFLDAVYVARALFHIPPSPDPTIIATPAHLSTGYGDAQRQLIERTLTTIQEEDRVFKAKLYRWESVGIKKLLRGAELGDSIEHGDFGKEDAAALAQKAPGLERATFQYAEKELPTIHKLSSAVYNPDETFSELTHSTNPQLDDGLRDRWKPFLIRIEEEYRRIVGPHFKNLEVVHKIEKAKIEIQRELFSMKWTLDYDRDKKEERRLRLLPTPPPWRNTRRAEYRRWFRARGPSRLRVDRAVFAVDELASDNENNENERAEDGNGNADDEGDNDGKGNKGGEDNHDGNNNEDNERCENEHVKDDECVKKLQASTIESSFTKFNIPVPI